MPIRRTPSSASPGPSSHSTPPPSRLRENDNMSLSDFTVQGSSSGGYGEAKVISVLVGRIVNKLPCNSGNRLEMLENDPGIKQTIDTLMTMVNIRQGLVLQALGHALETLAKYSNTSITETSLETTQSQIYILHILLQALSTCWRTFAQSHPPPPGDLPRAFPDLPTLDEGVARYLLSIVLLYAKLASSGTASLPGNSSPAPTKEKHGHGTTSSISFSSGMPCGSNTNVLGSKFIQQHSFPAGSTSLPPSRETKRSSADCQTTHNAINQMTKLLSRITFIISTSNWNLFLIRIKARISYLQTTIEDSPDLVELRLLEWSNVNRVRLSSALQEISSTFLHTKRPAQISVAIVLRKAIWNWIDVHPAELDHVIETNSKVEGGAEVLFDVLQAASDITSSSHAKRTRAFYPLMAMLMVICPDIFKKAAMGDTGGRLLGGLTKKSSFLESVRKGVTSSKGFEACTICYVDFVRASMCLSPRWESTGIRSIVPDIQKDLTTALFSSANAGELADPNLLVDGLVALYRADPLNVSTVLFFKLLNETNERNRTAAIKACLIIQIEDARLPWFPASSVLRKRVAPLLRRLLKYQINTLLDDKSASKRPRIGSNLPSSQNDLITDILQLFITDPQYALESISTDPSDSLLDLLKALSGLLAAPSPSDIRNLAVRSHVSLLDAMAHEDESSLRDCADAIWHILIDASRQVLHAIHSSTDDMNDSFSGLRDLAVSIASLATRFPDQLAISRTGEPAVLLNMVTVVMGLVIGLVSPDFEQAVQSVPALKALKVITLVANKSFIPGESPQGTDFGPPSARIAMRCRFFDTYLNLPAATGRQQQQRQYRKAQKAFAFPSTGGIAMWLGCAHLAKNLTSLVIAADASNTTRSSIKKGSASEIDGLDDDQSKAWQNMTLFLAATATVCVYDETPPPPLVDTVGKGILPRLYDESPDPMAACDDFVRECVDLLVSGSIRVRETVKEALGQELSPSLMRIMISQMTKLLGHSVGSGGIKASDTFTTFVDQILAVLKLAIDRLDPVEQGLQLDLSDLVSLLVRYLSRLDRDESNLRIKTKFCQFVESMSSKSESITIANQGMLKNNILDQLVEWSVEAQRDRDLQRNSPEAVTKIYREVELASLRAMAPLTENLVLRAPGDDSDSTVTVVKTRLFHRYYAHLVKILERSQSTFEFDSSSPASFPGTAGRPTLDQTSSLTIAVLSNLLSANLDVGLKHCLSMGYHEDPALRTAFMRLLTSILQQGARFGGLSQKRLSASSKLYLDLLTQTPDNLALAVAICEACPPTELDEISTLLFRVFETKGYCLELVKMLVEREIALTNHESDLFRANSITTRMLTIFAKTYGYNYVRATLQPLVHSLVEKPAECSFELDPSKAGPNDDIERNADHLQLMCQALLDLICTSTARAPIQFRALCHHLWEVTADKFPESRHSVIGSFIFLRFFCPSIVAPENIDLDISPDTREVRRALLLITKVIQNLANNVTFGNKEPHMKVLNGFLSENIRQVSKFLSDLGVKPKAGEVADAIGKTREEVEKTSDPDGDEAILYRFISKYFTKIESALTSLPSTYRYGSGTSRSDKADLDGRAVLSRLQTLMDKTGPHSDGKGLSASARSQAYDDFIRHNVGRNTESVAGAFYEGPVSQNGRRIFYFIVSRVGLLDYDLLAFHVFSILDQVTDFFDLVIDLTDFSAANELPMAWLKRSLQMCPPGILPCINTLALYNANGYARQRVRRIAVDLASIAPSVGKQVIAASSPSELAEFIPFSSLALPEYTMALAYEAEHVFTNLLWLSDHERQVPVVVKLGHDCIQIASWRKQDLTATVKSYIIDVIRLRDIDDILTGGALPSDHLVIKHCQSETVTFISRKRNEMAQIIRIARSRLREGPSEERIIRPSDVPGTLLNVAMLNLSSGDEALRLGAHNLINELSGFFKWDTALSVSKVTAGLNIPQNSLSFVYSLSSSLARSAPQLTPEFLKEWTIGFARSNDISQKCAALHYVAPWLANLQIFVLPSKEREDIRSSRKVVAEIIRGLVGITVTERRRLHLSIHEHIWSRLAHSHETMIEVVAAELIHTAIDAGFGTERSECVADILVSMGGTVVRGKVIARLRKVIAQTYLKPSPTLADNIAWPEISSLSRIVLALSFNPTSALDAQLFLPELLHIITLLVGAGPLLIRQTVYGLAVNIVQSLASSVPTGDMDTAGLQRSLKTLQEKGMMVNFGLSLNGSTFEAGKIDEEGAFRNVEGVTKLFGEVLSYASVSIDCANAWRARWMSLVAATCFQHNPATQPQAFAVLGYLASDEIDDDTVYQILVSMSTTLTHYSETDNILLISILKCLSRIIPGLSTGSRYASSLFWLSIGIMQMGHIPPFAAALELMMASLKAISKSGSDPIIDTLLRARLPGLEAAKRLDQMSGVSFDSDPGFSFVGVIYKGIRHPSTKNLAIEAMSALLSGIIETGQDGQPVNGAAEGEKKGKVIEDGVGLFVALLPLLATSNIQEGRGECGRLRFVLERAGIRVNDVTEQSSLSLLTISESCTALLVVALLTTMVQSASSEVEKVVLYRLLADASAKVPDVLGVMYDSLIPRLTTVMSTTTSLSTLESVSQIIQTALMDPAYTFPQNVVPSESVSSFNHHALNTSGHVKNFSGSVSSLSPSLLANNARDQELEDLGMRSLSELSFGAKSEKDKERVSVGAMWVASLVDCFTS